MKLGSCLCGGREHIPLRTGHRTPITGRDKPRACEEPHAHQDGFTAESPGRTSASTAAGPSSECKTTTNFVSSVATSPMPFCNCFSITAEFIITLSAMARRLPRHASMSISLLIRSQALRLTCACTPLYAPKRQRGFEAPRIPSHKGPFRETFRNGRAAALPERPPAGALRAIFSGAAVADSSQGLPPGPGPPISECC